MKRVSPYIKMQVLGAIDYAQGKSRIERIRAVSEMLFRDEDGDKRQFTWRTIQTWYSRYSKDRITGMKPKNRDDLGNTRKIKPEELLEAINDVLPLLKNDCTNKMLIYRKIIEKGIISSSNLSQTSFYRFVREYELLKDDVEKSKKRLAFAMEYANQLWQGDTMFGPYIKNSDGKPVQSKLIAFIDDASRVLVHGQFFLTENTDTLIDTLKSAFYKRGIPDQIYVDNGGIYTSKELSLICLRVGCILRHAPVRDGASKGKIERFFRRVRDQFLSLKLNLSDIKTLNKQFNLWVESEYNSKKHSSIGLKPIDRFALDIKRIRFLPPAESSEELFYTEDTRVVKKDNTFTFKSIRYEAPADLRSKKINIRFNRHNPTRIMVYYKGQRMGEAGKVNFVMNSKIKRKHNMGGSK